MTDLDTRRERVADGSKRKRDLQAAPSAQSYFDDPALTARQKYRRFFADWRKQYGRPHSLEARWNADNEGRR